MSAKDSDNKDVYPKAYSIFMEIVMWLSLCGK